MRKLFFHLVILSALKSNSQVSFTLNANTCSGSTLITSALNGTNTALNFSWTSNPTGAVFSNATSSLTNIYFPVIGGFTIALNYTLTSGSGTYTKVIFVLPSPTVTVSQTGTITCIESNSPLFSKPTVINLSGASSYSWQPTVTTNSNFVATVRPPTPTCYTITGYNGPCSNTVAACITVRPRFTLNALASGTVICFTPDGGEFVTLSAANISTAAIGQPSAYTYSWSTSLIGGILTSPFQSSVAVSPSTSTTYTLEMKDSLGCVSLPVLTSISVMPCTGIDQNENDFSIIPYPNPCKDKLNLQFGSESFNIKEINIHNIIGQHFPFLNIKNEIHEIDLSHLPSGVYYLTILTNSFKHTQKIIKE